jgi:hypothetical protein
VFPTAAPGTKVALPAGKTGMFLLNGKLVSERPPIIEVNGKRIRRRQAINYVGLHFESGLNINKHIEVTTQKASNMFNSFAKETKAIITYAAAGW